MCLLDLQLVGPLKKQYDRGGSFCDDSTVVTPPISCLLVHVVGSRSTRDQLNLLARVEH